MTFEAARLVRFPQSLQPDDSKPGVHLGSLQRRRIRTGLDVTFVGHRDYFLESQSLQQNPVEPERTVAAGTSLLVAGTILAMEGLPCSTPTIESTAANRIQHLQLQESKLLKERGELFEKRLLASVDQKALTDRLRAIDNELDEIEQELDSASPDCQAFEKLVTSLEVGTRKISQILAEIKNRHGTDETKASPSQVPKGL